MLKHLSATVPFGLCVVSAIRQVVLVIKSATVPFGSCVVSAISVLLVL